MSVEDGIGIVYLVGAALTFLAVVVSGLTGRWSKDDWPLFAIIGPIMWPLAIGAAAWFVVWDWLVYRDRSPRDSGDVQGGSDG